YVARVNMLPFAGHDEQLLISRDADPLHGGDLENRARLVRMLLVQDVNGNRIRGRRERKQRRDCKYTGDEGRYESRQTGAELVEHPSLHYFGGAPLRNRSAQS